MDHTRLEKKSERMVKRFAASQYAKYVGYAVLAVAAIVLLKWIF